MYTIYAQLPIMHSTDTSTLSELYADAQQCAALVGLTYGADDSPGIARLRHGKGFRFTDHTGKTIADKQTKRRIAELVIPPAWQQVWICPDDKGHILATGVDDKGRKQYIYHPKWRTVRDLIKFYRLIVFAESLPKIRRSINQHLDDKDLSFTRVIAGMLWILDNTYIRVGNDTYLNQNDSMGLTTLTDYNVIIQGPVVNLSFRGKSGKEHNLSFEQPAVADIVAQARAMRGERLFQYKDAYGKAHPVTSSDVNRYLRDVTGQNVSAKDFRTWGGTLMAFMHLADNLKPDKKPEKVAIEAVDNAADILGNTRAVAKSSYVHPDLLQVYGSKNFTRYYRQAQRVRNKPGLDKGETELLEFLKFMFEEEFELLQKTN